MMPIISVIIPVYNGEKTIRETIESVLKQTFNEFELIIVNDGSKDQTLEIVNSIQDSRIKVFSYQNAGLSASRNRGITQASGEYISFIDADDLWTPDKLESQLKALQENPQAAVAYSWTDYIDETGRFLRQGSHVSVSGNAFANLLLLNFLENGSNALIRKQALLEVGEFDESLSSAEDWDMWLRLALRYDFVVVRSPQVLYRTSATSMSANVLKMEAEDRRVRERAIAQAAPSIKHLNQIGRANWYKYLTFKALEGFPEAQKGLIAARFLWNAVTCDRTLLQTKVFWKVLFKIAAISLLPPQMAKAVLIKSKNLANIHPLLLQIQLELPAEIVSGCIGNVSRGGFNEISRGSTD